jgi:hypothetical protein
MLVSSALLFTKLSNATADAELEALLEPLGRDKKKAKLSRRLQQATCEQFVLFMNLWEKTLRHEFVGWTTCASVCV